MSEFEDSKDSDIQPGNEPASGPSSEDASAEAKAPEQVAPLPTRSTRWWLKWTSLVLIFAGVLLLAIVFAVWSTVRDVSWLERENPKETAMMRYRDAQRAEKKQGQKRIWRWVRLSQISPHLIHAVIISEDDKFYQHEGFDWDAIKEAWDRNKKRGRFAFGGSTITQQLAKNLFLKPTKNPLRKIREAVIAFELEKKLSKQRILELYLNVIEWGDGIYGAQAAAQVYFGKPAAALTPAEAIRLALVLPNPRRYSPLRNTGKWMNERRRTLAERMFKRGWLSEIDYFTALTKLGFAEGSGPVTTGNE